MSTKIEEFYRESNEGNSENSSTTLYEVEILHILVYFYHLSYCFWLIFGPCWAMFMTCFVVLIEMILLPILRSQLGQVCSRFKGLLLGRS